MDTPEVTQLGMKFDTGKLRYDLLPPLALEEVVKVLTFGANKYAPNNWRYVDDPFDRYFAAAQRHQWGRKRGEVNDSESTCHHYAHAICCLMFMLELELEKDKKEGPFDKFYPLD